MELTNKKIQYTVTNESTNVKLSGTVYVNESLKVTEFNGSILLIDSTNTYNGSFNWNTGNISVNLQNNDTHISEASQLVLDTITAIETKLATA